MIIIASLLMVLMGWFGVSEALEMKGTSHVNHKVGIYIILVFLLALTLISFI